METKIEAKQPSNKNKGLEIDTNLKSEIKSGDMSPKLSTYE